MNVTSVILSLQMLPITVSVITDIKSYTIATIGVIIVTANITTIHMNVTTVSVFVSATIATMHVPTVTTVSSLSP